MTICIEVSCNIRRLFSGQVRQGRFTGPTAVQGVEPVKGSAEH